MRQNKIPYFVCENQYEYDDDDNIYPCKASFQKLDNGKYSILKPHQCPLSVEDLTHYAKAQACKWRKIQFKLEKGE
jgi:hypothetical protein